MIESEPVTYKETKSSPTFRLLSRALFTIFLHDIHVYCILWFLWYWSNSLNHHVSWCRLYAYLASGHLRQPYFVHCRCISFYANIDVFDYKIRLVLSPVKSIYGFNAIQNNNTWWRPCINTFSPPLALCKGNLPVAGRFTPQRATNAGLWYFGFVVSQN